jgi:hypothetical protein
MHCLSMGNQKNFRNSKKSLIYCPRTNFPVTSWTSLGHFSKNLLFLQIYFILNVNDNNLDRNLANKLKIEQMSTINLESNKTTLRFQLYVLVLLYILFVKCSLSFQCMYVVVLHQNTFFIRWKIEFLRKINEKTFIRPVQSKKCGL